MLSVAALVDGKIMCVHGGLSPDIATLDQIRTIVSMNLIPESSKPILGPRTVFLLALMVAALSIVGSGPGNPT